jgi:hypothetical protein
MGEIAKFWSHAWLDGQAPAVMAPLLFKLARRKHLSVNMNEIFLRKKRRPYLMVVG